MPVGNFGLSCRKLEEEVMKNKMGDLVSLPKTGSKVSLKSWWTFLRVVLVLLITLDTIDGQLIGSRGVFTLPEGMEYRDALTRDASKYDRFNFTFLIPSLFFQDGGRLCHALPGEGGQAG